MKAWKPKDLLPSGHVSPETTTPTRPGFPIYPKCTHREVRRTYTNNSHYYINI